MFRPVLPVVICWLALPAAAEGLRLPGLSNPAETRAQPKACLPIPNSPDSCVRVLACIGDSGLYFNGHALGWDTGPVVGKTSAGEFCEGTWKSGWITGTAHLTCTDGLTVDVLYYKQDNDTGTVTGSGTDSLGRSVITWTGENVLKFLTEKGRPGPELPCGPTPIPIS